MWLLTCDGDLFGGKRLWLRPGSIHLLGRTSGVSEAGERIQYINHKSVSRKHLTIEVGQVKTGDGTRLHSRSEIRVKDGSKMGTTLNGEKICQDSKTLNAKEYTIKLGNYEHLFHLWWRPVTLSYTSSSKKSKSDPLAAYRETLEQSDVKIISEYVSNETTHTISKKRNTTAVLQALLQAKWVVTEAFVEALTGAVERRGPDGTCSLEEDFDGNWPSETDYLVPSGGEPQPKPDEYLKPNNDRIDLLQDHTFVFLSQGQYDNLLPVVTVGGGKAVLKEVEPAETSVEDVVQYVKEVAGQKGRGHFRLSQQQGKGGVAVVRTNEGEEAWRTFLRDLELALDQRGVQQNEFLDIILTGDVSGLRRQLPDAQDESEAPESERSQSRPQSQATQQQQQRAITVADSPAPEQERPPTVQSVDEQPAEEPVPKARNRYRRHITQSRFKGFDDFDPSQFSKPAPDSPEPSQDNPEPSQAPSAEGMDVEQPQQTQHSSRKRPAPVEEEEEEDMYASILTGHAAVKRQRTEAARNGGKNGSSKSLTEADRLAAEKAAKAKKKAKEIDVMAEVQARREREDEQRRKDEEHLRQALDGVDIKDLKNLAKVEEMEIPVREKPSRSAGENGRSESWDPAWNGRKNFKRFRPQGQRDNAPRLQRVIVTLEEVPRKGHGLGDEYWLNSNSTNRKSKSQSQSQSVRQGTQRSQRDEDNDEDAARFRRRLQTSREEDEDNAAAEEVYPEEIAGHARDEALEAAANSSPSQTFGTESQRKAKGKRPAAQQAGPPAKKARQTKTASSSREPITLDDDDDDALKFRRRRR